MLSHFTTWLRAKNREVDVALLENLLDLRATYDDLEPTLWPAGSVQDLLLRLVPAKGPAEPLPSDDVVNALDAYFRFLSDVIEEQRDDLAARLAPYAGLYDYRDWLFSAPKPLPRAHLHAPQDGAAAGAPFGAADFVRVDFAFWLGDRLVAVQSAGSALTPKKAREQTDRLRLAGVEVVPFSPGDLAGGKAREFFGRILGSLAQSFWNGDVLPAGPFRTALLDE